MIKQPCVYIMASQNHNAIYIGVTSNLMQRVWQHKNNVCNGFSRKYQTHLLVHFELFEDMNSAIAREKQLKNWHRLWKINLIEQNNFQWLDLSEGF
ncbi:GIY-YIG nuclease family protein [Vibrio sp. FNV 38]|nr:GIY-YIG nuclease family protein [Vibrio sp. FNV 38]